MFNKTKIKNNLHRIIFLKGFHVHVYGVTASSPNCTAAGAHFNPYSK